MGQPLLEYVIKEVMDLLLLLQVHQQLLQRVVAVVDHHILVHQHQFHILDGQEDQEVRAVVQVDIFHLHNQEL